MRQKERKGEKGNERIQEVGGKSRYIYHKVGEGKC